VNLAGTALKDQQNRFDAGTVPRFNGLQAEVALYNQISATDYRANNYRISKITLPRHWPRFPAGRGENPPLDGVGEMPIHPAHHRVSGRNRVWQQRRPFSSSAGKLLTSSSKCARQLVSGSQPSPKQVAANGSARPRIPVHDISQRLDRAGPGQRPDFGTAAQSLAKFIQQRALFSGSQEHLRR